MGPLPAGVEPVPALSGAGQSYPERTQADYEAMVRAAQVHIERGDVFQMVPSQLIARPTAASPFSLYRALRAVNPSPYMVFCDLGDRQIVSASPETHVSLSREGVATLKPIAGTRRRDADGAADDALARELEADEKERAEHLMLVDLARNDLGRVCEPGTVRVSKLLEVERYSHVMHLVSQVDGALRGGQDALSLLAGDVPGRHGQRRAEGARDAADLGRSRARAGASTRARSATSASTARSTRASPCARSSCATASRCCRRARASWPTPTRPASTSSA